MVYISKELSFCSAHKLYNPKWSKEKNEEVFEGCAHENWHGHNYHLTVTIKGDPDPETGLVMNFRDLKAIIKEHIIDKVDHKNLNLDVEFLKGKMTSCEVFVKEIWGQLEPKIAKETNNKVKLHKLLLFETSTSSAEYFGE